MGVGLTATFLSLMVLAMGIQKQLLLKPSDLPEHGHIAVVVRGQSFRAQYDECNESAIEDQIFATRSLLQKVVEPFERRGNRVDIFLANSNDCKLGELLYREVGDRRVKRLLNFTSMTQADGMKNTLASFEEALASVPVQQLYDQIIITRHDLVFVTGLDQWPADFSKLNFGAWFCPEDNFWGKDCRCDWFYTMPGSLYSAFSRSIGQTSCFNQDWCHGCGHGCLPHMSDNAAGQVSTIFDESLPDGMKMKALNKSNAKHIYLYGVDCNMYKDCANAK